MYRLHKATPMWPFLFAYFLRIITYTPSGSLPSKSSILVLLFQECACYERMLRYGRCPQSSVVRSTSLRQRMRAVVHEQIQFHEERLALHEQALQKKRREATSLQEETAFFELSEVLFAYTIGYEHNYLAWCHPSFLCMQKKLDTEKA